MMKAGVFCIGIVVLFLMSAHLSGAVIFVPDNFSSIQGAVSAAQAGDEIVVRVGVYRENIDFMGKTITLRSQRGPAFTTIDGTHSGSVVLFNKGEGPSSILDGFTLTNGSGTVRGPYTMGGGIYCHLNSSPTIRDCLIIGNTATDGGGILCWDSCYPVFINTTIADNYGSMNSGGVGLDTASPTFINCTITNNGDPYDCGGIRCHHGYPTIVNTIVWGNSGIQILETPGSATITYSDIGGSGIWPGTGNINVDPEFVETATSDYHLAITSPCKDTGDNSFAGLAGPLHDFEGDFRSADSADPVDMGGDEFAPHLYCVGKVFPGSSFKLRITGEPGKPVFLALGSGIADPPQPTTFGDLHLPLPFTKTWLFKFGIGSDGIMELPAETHASWKPGDEIPFQALVGPLFSTKSRTTNLMILDVIENPLPVAAHWDFRQVAGKMAVDISGNGHHAEIFGATWREGYHGSALSFNGTSSDYLATNWAPVYGDADSFTWEAIVMHDGSITDYMSILGFEYTLDGEVSLGLNETGYTGHAIGYSRCDDYQNHGGGHLLRSQDPLSADEWHHIALVRDRDIKEYRFYVDGVLQVSIPDNNGAKAINQERLQPLAIGCKIHNGQVDRSFKGAIDEVRITDDALAPEDFLSFVAPRFIDAHWPFSEMAGSVLGDVSGNGRDGTIFGSTWVTGYRGGALHVDGTGTDYVTTDFVPIYGDTDSYTWEAILRFDEVPLVYHAVAVGFENSDDGEITIGADNDQAPGCFVASSRCDNYNQHGGGHVLSSPEPYRATGWHHVALVRDRDRMEYRLYVDHALQVVKADNNTGSPINDEAKQPLGIGCQSHNGTWDKFFRGTIDEIRLANRALPVNQFLPFR